MAAADATVTVNVCSHTFPWHGVVPPSHCPCCGRPLGRWVWEPYPVAPSYPPPYSPVGPVYSQGVGTYTAPTDYKLRITNVYNSH